MSEENINKIVEEHYGFTVEEIDNMVGNLSLKINQLQQENQQLLETSKAYKKLLKTTMEKEHQAIKVLDEIREVIIELRNIIYNPDYENFGLSKEQYKDRFIHIFEILDKVKK